MAASLRRTLIRHTSRQHKSLQHSIQFFSSTFTALNKTIAILFLTVYLLSTTELSQLCKLPAFVGHFIEHKQEKKDLTLWQFLCIHYANNNKPDADHEKDMQLPFKTHDNCTAQISIAIPPTYHFLSTQRVQYIVDNKPNYPHDVFVSSSFIATIWQPPKSC